ncbi:PAS domain S-box protein [Trichocoleus sp. FACHB-262]|uniref:PAS domain S-box protein n=1 Tax=Trichocoleus sp. FACHB-262 TaxID=2692869 RepID=UPI001687F42C|nr:PAS domain S-box protein [Trichocoleus sp. FACHB-262]MBD2124378.1 PAS domain S-box protein [Trichocoleus sp. FACHB-262]
MEVALSQLWRYGGAVLLVAIASFLILLASDSTIADNPWLIGLAPVILSARYGGLGPGLLATVLMGVACAYSSPPSLTSSGAIAPNDLVEWSVFALEGILISALMRLHTAPSQHQRGPRSKLQLRTILDNAPVGLYVVGSSSHEFMNQHLCAWLGLTSEQILGNGWIDSIHPEDREWVIRASTESLTAGQTFEAEYRILDQEGTLYWILDRAVPVRDEAGQVQFFQGSCVDITARKQAEERLQSLAQQLQERTAELSASRAQMQALLDYTPAIIYIIDVDGYMRFANAEWYRIFGPLFGNPIEGQNLRDFLPPEAAAVFFQENEEIFASAKVMTFENDMTLPDGVHTFLRIKFPLQDASGEVYAFCGVSLDITERKQGEEALRQSEERFRSLSACSPLGIFLTDTQGNCTYTNPSWQAIAGLTFEAALGEGWAEAIHPEDRERVAAYWFYCASSGQAYSDEFRFQRRETVCWVHSRSSPLFADNGQLMGHVGTVEDITERKQANEKLQALTRQLQAQNEQLTEVSRLKSEFLTNMSHELRTPLTSILGFSSVLLQKNFGALNPKQEQYLSLIHSSGDHLLALINDLLDLAKIEAGKLELDFEELNLAALCQAALEMVEVRALSKQQQLSQELPLACEFILGDRQRILQVLLNYLSNAIKFTPGGGTITLKTQVVTDVELQNFNVLEVEEEAALQGASTSMFVGLSVSDTGIGIPVEDQHLLFQTFQQVDGATDRRHGGTGLGLALTKRLVELHGGKVSFTSTCGVGSTFSAWFPLPESNVEPI